MGNIVKYKNHMLLGLYMMNDIAPIMGVLVLLALIILLVCLLSKGRYQNFKKRLILKSLCSLMFWLFGWIALWYAKSDVVPFTAFMMAGFTLSVFGDVFLAFKSDNAFIIGLLSFFLAHVAYSVSFIMRYGFSMNSLVAFAVISLVFLVVINFSGLFDLKEMLVPANLYLIIISFMLANAIGGLLSISEGFLTTALTAFGALLFFISDFILAYEKFSPRQGMALEKPVLVTYYSAQIFLALGMMTFLL